MPAEPYPKITLGIEQAGVFHQKYMEALPDEDPPRFEFLTQNPNVVAFADEEFKKRHRKAMLARVKLDRFSTKEVKLDMAKPKQLDEIIRRLKLMAEHTQVINSNIPRSE